MTDKTELPALPQDQEALIAAAEKHAEAYSDDPRDCIVADVCNAFFAGARYAALAAAPVAPSPDRLVDALIRIGLIDADARDNPEGYDGGETMRRFAALAATLGEAPVAQAAQPVAQWQPIETAPKDGTSILVFPPTWVNKPCSIAKWDTDQYAKKPRPYWRRDDDQGQVSYSRNTPPTHWLPLPEAPDAQEAP